MVSKAFARVAIVALLLLPVVAAPLVIAQDNLEYYVQPRTSNATEIYNLFQIISWLALVVFVFVEGLLFYIVFRFRKNKTVPKGETHRGHTQAEIFWTLVPALVFIFIGVLSVQTLEKLDKIPEDTDVTIQVMAEQFAWTFTYPDGSQDINEVWIEQGHKVKLEVLSKDVLHAVWIPAFAIKIDAVPGRTNTVWFPTDTEGNFLLQCAEYCKYGHHAMRADVNVFKAGANGGKAFGAPPGAKGPETDYSKIPYDVNATAALVERKVDPAPADAIWGIAPATITVKQGQGVHIFTKNEGKGVHNLAIPAYNVKTRDLPGGAEAEIAFVADQVGEFEYLCAIPGHKDLGMVGKLVVTA